MIQHFNGVPPVGVVVIMVEQRISPRVECGGDESVQLIAMHILGLLQVLIQVLQ
jgi:hypothetical protein